MVTIPALWTNLTDEQDAEVRAYVGDIFFAAMNHLDGGYRLTFARDPFVCCGLCECPIGRNHNYLTAVPVYTAPHVCFDCAEELVVTEVYDKPVFDESDWTDAPVSPLSLDASMRIPEEVRNP